MKAQNNCDQLNITTSGLVYIFLRPIKGKPERQVLGRSPIPTLATGRVVQPEPAANYHAVASCTYLNLYRSQCSRKYYGQGTLPIRHLRPSKCLGLKSTGFEFNWDVVHVLGWKHATSMLFFIRRSAKSNNEKSRTTIPKIPETRCLPTCSFTQTGRIRMENVAFRVNDSAERFSRT